MALVVLLAVALVAGPVRAQRGSPSYRLHNWQGRVGFEVRNDYDVRKSTDAARNETNEWSLVEEAEVGADGWLYHPLLFQFSGRVGGRFDQDFVEQSDSGLGRVDGSRATFHINGSLLPRKPYPISLFASQVHSEITSPFAPRRTIDTLSYGAGTRLGQLSIGDGYLIPTRMQYRHVEVDTGGGFGSDRRRDDIELAVENDTERTRSRLRYNWLRQESLSAGSSHSYQRNDVRLVHDRDLDGGRWSSQALFSDTRDGVKSRTASLNEIVNLPHGRNLSSSYSAVVNYQQSGVNDQLAGTVGAGVTHQLYSSLTSSAGVGASYRHSDLGDTVTGTGNLAFTYSKSIPYGRFGLRFSPSYAFQDDDVRSGLVTVLAEDHAVVFGQRIVLENLQVVPGSIIVTDPVTLVDLVEGVDYEVVVEGLQTSLRALPGGDLDSGTVPAVEVRYDYQRDPSRRFGRLTMAYGSSLSLFDHLGFDVSYTDVSLDVMKSSAANTTLSEESRFRAVMDLYFTNSRTRAEYERLRSDITPRERFGVNQTVSFRPRRGTTLGMGAGYSHDRITDRDRVSDSVTFSLNSTSVLPFRVIGRLNVSARYLDEEEQRAWSQGATVSLSYRYRRLLFELRDRVRWMRADAMLGVDRETREQLNSVLFRVERTF